MSLPLTIRLVDYSEWVYKHDKVINILNNHSIRWHDMCFDLPGDYLHHLSGSSQGNILHWLVLLSQPDPANLSSTFSIKSKPSLTDLTLIGVGISYIDIVWNNLAIASVNDIGVDECFELIHQAPFLRPLGCKQSIPPPTSLPFLTQGSFNLIFTH